jgi:hypothetical protein
MNASTTWKAPLARAPAAEGIADYDDLLTLARCDRAGRQPGAEAPELDEALDYLRELSRTFGG